MSGRGSVLVTRPEPEAWRTAEKLAALGWQPIVAPLIVAQAMPDSPPMTGFDAVAMTSARAVEHMRAADRAALADLPAFAVGARTADAMRSAGFRHVASADGDVTALAALIAGSGMKASGRVAHIGGQDRAGDLSGLVAISGIKVETIAVYRMAPVTELPEIAHRALEDGSIVAVVHYSPRSAEIFRDLICADRLIGGAARARHVCLSSQVAEPLRTVFGATITIAREPSEPSLLEALGA